jgi:hypothetical protein
VSVLVKRYLSRFQTSASDRVRTLPKVPIHLHIPKCGGTFVRRLQNRLVELYCASYVQSEKVLPERLVVRSKNHAEPLAVVYTTSEKPIEQLEISWDGLLSAWESGSLELFSITLTPETYQDTGGSYSKFIDSVSSKRGVSWYTVLRDSFEKAVSMYYVLQARGVFPVAKDCLREFESFLRSPHSGNNWNSKFLSKILVSLEGELNDTEFGSLIKTMKTDVTVIPFKQIGKGVEYVFSDTYSAYIGKFASFFESEAGSNMFNRTPKQVKFKPQDVEEACLREFKNANSYDIALFEKFVEGDEHTMSLTQNKNQVDSEIITWNT